MLFKYFSHFLGVGVKMAVVKRCKTLPGQFLKTFNCEQRSIQISDAISILSIRPPPVLFIETCKRRKNRNGKRNPWNFYYVLLSHFQEHS